jgi:hypothetical protein
MILAFFLTFGRWARLAGWLVGFVEGFVDEGVVERFVDEGFVEGFVEGFFDEGFVEGFVDKLFAGWQPPAHRPNISKTNQKYNPRICENDGFAREVLEQTKKTQGTLEQNRCFRKF